MTIILQEALRGAFYAPFYVALERDAFNAEGVDIKFTSSPHPDKTALRVMDGTVDTWSATRPTAALPNNNACQWIRAPAVRIALLARNSQVDRNALLPTSQTSVTWAGAAPLLRNETARNNWRNYRYKVFETVVPIRNLPWMARCS